MKPTKSFDKLSERQRNILRFMDRYMDANGYPPTIREIGEATNIASTSVVNYNLNKLVKAGYLERSGRVSRGLRLIGDLPGKAAKQAAKAISAALDSIAVPYYGHIVASEPVEIPEDIYPDEDNSVEITLGMLGGADPTEVFALSVRGNSMIDAMIRDGDTVIMRRTETARNGEMVAVWLDERGETTLKYFYNEGDRIRLQPAHPEMTAIYVDPAHCHIRGKVLSVIRQMH